MVVLWVPLLALLATPSAALLAYDCSSDVHNTTTISLLEVGECETPKSETNQGLLATTTNC